VQVAGIYELTNLKTNQHYVGQSIRLHDRIRDMLSNLKIGKFQNSKLQADYNKYGKDNFRITPLETNVDKEDLDIKEQFWIEQYDSFKNGYNNDLGGRFNKIVPQEVNAKISKSKKGKKLNLSESEIKRRIDYNKYEKDYSYMQGENHPFYGKSSPARKSFVDEEKEQIIKLYTEGFSLRKITDWYNSTHLTKISRATIRSRLQEWGVLRIK
jgi:group I intron endonuclease